MVFFDGINVRDYTAQIKQELKEEVNKISDSNIMTCDLQEWIEYLVGKYEITPITIFEESIVQSLSETKVKKYNPFSKHRISIKRIWITSELLIKDSLNYVLNIPKDELLSRIKVHGRYKDKFIIENVT